MYIMKISLNFQTAHYLNTTVLTWTKTILLNKSSIPLHHLEILLATQKISSVASYR